MSLPMLMLIAYYILKRRRNKVFPNYSPYCRNSKYTSTERL